MNWPNACWTTRNKGFPCEHFIIRVVFKFGSDVRMALDVLYIGIEADKKYKLCILKL